MGPEVQAQVDALIAAATVQADLLQQASRARNDREYRRRFAAVKGNADAFNSAAIALRTALGLPLSQRLEDATE